MQIEMALTHLIDRDRDSKRKWLKCGREGFFVTIVSVCASWGSRVPMAGTHDSCRTARARITAERFKNYYFVYVGLDEIELAKSKLISQIYLSEGG